METRKNELNENLNEDELIRALRAISENLQSTPQDEGSAVMQKFTPLAFQLSESFYLTHYSTDVQLLVACCIADILRIFAPEAPFKDADQIKSIFIFLTRQLEGLQNLRNKSFSRYFYLLENLAYVKSFNMCFEIEDNQEVFIELFVMIFKVVNDEQNIKIKNFMLDIMTPLITESDTVSNELLDCILMNVIEPQKSKNKCAYQLAKSLIVKTSVSFAPYLKIFLSSELILKDSHERNFQTTGTKIFELIYELYNIAPDALLPILPNLECKLQSKEESDRIKTVNLLSKMFAEHVELTKECPQLWTQYKARFPDISVAVRVQCVKGAKDLLVKHEHLREELIDLLRARNRDLEESVRFEVVTATVEIARNNWRLVASSPLLEFLRERTMDMKFRVRKEALQCFSVIYKSYMTAKEHGEELDKTLDDAAKLIQNKILHGYYITTIEDKILIERLLITCLVPYQLPSPVRMKVLLQLLNSIDEYATKAFIELQKHQTKLRRLAADWIKCVSRGLDSLDVKKEVFMRVSAIAKQLPEPVKAQEFLVKFSNHMQKEPQLIADIDKFLRKEILCTECTDTMQSILRRLGHSSPTNFYHHTVKLLLNRVASVTVDRLSLKELLKNVSDDLKDSQDVTAVRVLPALAQAFAGHFQHEAILQSMISLMNIKHPVVDENILKTFTVLAAHRPVMEASPEVQQQLITMCKTFMIKGPPKVCKRAIYCIVANSQSPDNNNLKDADPFEELIKSWDELLNASNPNYRTAIVSLGHLSAIANEKYRKQINGLIARKIVKELLLGDIPEGHDHSSPDKWCEELALPPLVHCMMEGIKTLARWVTSLKSETASAQKTLKMFDLLLVAKGDYHDKLSAAEKSWMRLTAGKGTLKICEEKALCDTLKPEQFLNLAQLMTDETREVRENIAKRLHKGLGRNLTENYLPASFMGLYVMGGFELDQKLYETVQEYVVEDVKLRRKHIQSMKSESLSKLHPELMLIYGIAVLAHTPVFTDPTNNQELNKIEKCLALVLDPLMANQDFYCKKTFEKLLQSIKLHKSAVAPDDEAINKKLWTVAEIAMNLLKNSAGEQRSELEGLELPAAFYQKQPEDFSNDTRYLSNFLLGSSIMNRDSDRKDINSRKRSFSKSDSSADEESDEDVNGFDQLKKRR